ncbi:hypothetical protein GCM10009721_08790 [Terrabacter tumescens]|uniref:Uncharacterized protein n=1 Tax=Terrabacter tumescens TaxID=60443 RepID=A0ABQ2HPB9_9MICO|nr:hypothetical protein [Terrabacter tumescens]GGM86237.1 hypothetical protein GCM10009721_08790 [Terrabacter tumescens]
MEIPRQHIIEILNNRGDHEQAQKAQAELPDPVDLEQHEDDLRRLRISHEELPGWARGPADEGGES